MRVRSRRRANARHLRIIPRTPAPQPDWDAPVTAHVFDPDPETGHPLHRCSGDFSARALVPYLETIAATGGLAVLQHPHTDARAVVGALRSLARKLEEEERRSHRRSPSPPTAPRGA